MAYYTTKFPQQHVLRPLHYGVGISGENYEYALPNKWYQRRGEPVQTGNAWTYLGDWSSPQNVEAINWSIWDDLPLRPNWPELPEYVGFSENNMLPLHPLPVQFRFEMLPKLISTGEMGFEVEVTISDGQISDVSDQRVEYGFQPVADFKWFRLIPDLIGVGGWTFSELQIGGNHTLFAGELYASPECGFRPGPGQPGDPPLPGPDNP